MSLAPHYLYSSHPFPKFCLHNHSSSSSFTLCSQSHPKLFPSNSLFHLSFSTSHPLKPSPFILRASDTESKSDTGLGDSDDADQPYEEYEVELQQPYGLKFAKGRDGGTYIDAIAPGGFADKTGLFTVGDRVIATRLFLTYSSLFFSIQCLLPKSSSLSSSSNS